MHALMYNRIWIDEKVTSINFAASPISSYERCVRAWPPVSLSLSLLSVLYMTLLSRPCWRLWFSISICRYTNPRRDLTNADSAHVIISCVGARLPYSRQRRAHRTVLFSNMYNYRSVVISIDVGQQAAFVLA